MLVMASGRERIEAEYSQVLRAAGLQLSRVVPTPAGTSVVEAVPATRPVPRQRTSRSSPRRRSRLRATWLRCPARDYDPRTRPTSGGDHECASTTLASNPVALSSNARTSTFARHATISAPSGAPFHTAADTPREDLTCICRHPCNRPRGKGLRRLS